MRRLILAQTCAMIAISTSWAQLAPTTGTDQSNQTGAAGTTPATAENVVNMSPFQVTAESKGYYSPNTMSGTRINASIADLASSITVVTKQQMQDFAMLDINDVFLYAANTEGTGTYTDFVIDRNGSVQDNVELNPTGANRIRGIAPANIALDNIEMMGREPIDPVGIDSIEISRGPNANVFGLGNPSGTVNLVPSYANLTRNTAEVQARTDSYGGYRESLDFNRVLLNDKLAVRASNVFEHDGFTRKPSGVNTVRYNGMIRYKPFKSTTISAGYSVYRMNGNRPNAIPPRDNLSYWIASGKPTWDPTTGQIHINGATVGTYTSATYNGPDYFSATEIGATYSQMFIDQNGLDYWSAPQAFNNTAALIAGTTTRGPTSGGQFDRYLFTTGAAGATGTAAKPSAQPLFNTTPTVSDKSVYDWSSINLAAPDRDMDRMLTTNVRIDQTFLDTPRQLLVAQAAFMREDSQRYQRNIFGGANDNGQSGQLEVDPNEKNLDGTVNPYFLRTFIQSGKPRTVWAPAKWDTYRAQLAYQLDLTNEKGWLKWLGKHQFTAYDEYKYRINRQYSYRDVMVDPKTWLPPGLYRANQSQVTGTPTVVALTQGNYRYYVGDANGFNVDYAPGDFSYGTYPYVWGNNVTKTFTTENTTLAQAATTDSSGGVLNTKTVLKTAGAVMQNHFFSDDLVVTLGTREDRVYTRFGNPAANLLADDGLSFNYPLINSWAPTESSNTGKTTNVQYVVRPFRDLPLVRTMGASSGFGHFLAEALAGLSLNYNHSDSFIPATPAQDLFLNPLPNPTGEDKSFGLGWDLFSGKVVLRVTHYQTAEFNSRESDANTISQRVIRTDLPLAGTTAARFVLYNVAGSTTATTGPNNNQYGWIQATNPTWTAAQVATELSKEMGLSTALMNALINPNPPIAATNDVTAKGTEIELNVNPTPNWTVSASVTDTQVYITNMSTALQNWINQRMPIWTTIKDPTINPALEPAQLWWNHNYGGSQTANQNFQSFVAVPYSLIQQLEGQANPETRRYNGRISTNFRLAGITDNHILKGFSIGGAVRYESPGAIGYYGTTDANGIYVSENANTPVYDGSHYFFDAVISYRTKLWNDKVVATFQLNARNITEGGGLQPIEAYPNGTISTYRIVDPREFILTATFDF
jgi:hypothetical protein